MPQNVTASRSPYCAAVQPLDWPHLSYHHPHSARFRAETLATKECEQPSFQLVQLAWRRWGLEAENTASR